MLFLRARRLARFAMRNSDRSKIHAMGYLQLDAQLHAQIHSRP
jgi:hypothetical protein